MDGIGSSIIYSGGVDFMMTTEGKVAHIDDLLYNVGMDTKISRGEVLALKSQRNALQPINRLPEEILTQIFLLLLPVELYYYGWRWSAPYKICLNLTRIYRLWRNVALECPQLWSKIVFRKDEKSSLITLFLDRSKMAKLDVSFGDYLQPVSTEVLKLLIGHMHRVVSFEIYSFSYRKTIRELLSEAGPCLKNLNLQYAYDSTIHFTALARSTRSIRLDTLYLRNFSLKWSSRIFRGLKSLVLLNVRSLEFKPELSDFLNILEACPALRVLELEEIHLEMSESAERRLIKLPCLKSLRLWCINFDAYLFLSECIVIPKDVEWKVNCHRFPIENPGLFTANLPERTTQCESFILGFSRRTLSIRSLGSVAVCTDLGLDWHHIPSQLLSSSLLSMMETLFGKSYWNNPTEITFNMHIDYEDLVSETQIPFWSRILALIQRIRSITVNFMYGYDVSDVKGFIDALTESSDSDLHSSVRQCPDLETLTIHNVGFSTVGGRQVISKLVDHLRHRKQCGRTLRMLHFSSCRGFGEKEEDDLRSLNVAGEIKFT